MAPIAELEMAPAVELMPCRPIGVTLPATKNSRLARNEGRYAPKRDNHKIELLILESHRVFHKAGTT